MLVFVMGYEHFDHSGDAGVRAWGQTLEEAFAGVAMGMYSLVAEPRSVQAKQERQVAVARETLGDTVVAWLNELVYLLDAFGFLGSEVVVHEASETAVEATVRGEEFDPERHAGGLLVKAATYHGLKAEKQNDTWTFEVIFDL